MTIKNTITRTEQAKPAQPQPVKGGVSFEQTVEDLTALSDLHSAYNDLLEWKDEAVKTSVRQLQAFQEMQAVAQKKETEKRQYKAHAEALADACRDGLKFLDSAVDNWENQAAFRRILNSALAAWKARGE